MNGTEASGEKFPGAESFLPKQTATLSQHQRAAEKCRGCDLYKNATQVVFGAGAQNSRIMLVGEQPGNEEDLKGQPFVGPAGKMLDKALTEAGIDRAALFLTNAVKHFKWMPAAVGKRRLHARPSARQTGACRPWLEREIEIVKPNVIVLMGSTAGQSLFGISFKVTAARGTPLENTPWAKCVIATFHPSAILRMPDRTKAHETYGFFVEDLRAAKAAARSGATR